MSTTWQAVNNGAGKHMWFLLREASTGTEYHWSENGSLVRYGSYATASKAAEKLNKLDILRCTKTVDAVSLIGHPTATLRCFGTANHDGPHAWQDRRG